MTKQQLRQQFKGKSHFEFTNGDKAFTDEYVNWLEDVILSMELIFEEWKY